MANALLQALQRQQHEQMTHQPLQLPPDLLGSLAELFSGKIGGQTLEQGIQNRLQPDSLRPALNPKQMIDAGLNIVGMAPIGMTVYHGSPHKFDKFDLSKIGTGEGAQAYGHGLYLSQANKVADEYAGKLSQKEIEIPGFTPNTPVEHDLISALTNRANTTQYGGVSDAVLNDLRNVVRTGQGERKEAAQKMLSAMGDFGRPVVTDAGYLYKIDIPDESIPHMLDLDKPLSEQSPEVQAALDKGGRRWLIEDGTGSGGGWTPWKSEGASKALLDSGIPGISYLDGGSRTAGEGTSNYVLFNDQLPRILERNGVPTGLQPWAPGEANALLGIQPPRPRNALGQVIPPTQYELAHAEAQRVAALPVEQGGLGLPAGNTAMERARAMGFDTDVLHGTNNDIQEFDIGLSKVKTGNPNAALGVFTTPNPSEASRYAEAWGKNGGNVMPLMVRSGESYQMPYKELDDLAMTPYRMMMAEPGYAPNKTIAFGDRVAQKAQADKLAKYNELASKEVSARRGDLLSKGYDTAVVLKGRPMEEVIAMKPKNIRSRFAAFNPQKRDSADLLATLAPYAVAAPFAASNLYDYWNGQ